MTKSRSLLTPVLLILVALLLLADLSHRASAASGSSRTVMIFDGYPNEKLTIPANQEIISAVPCSERDQMGVVTYGSGRDVCFVTLSR
jgi:hypothetical protein